MNSETRATELSDPLNRFTKFSKLPTELRWTIWRMAICSDPTPRIHYYSLFNDDIEGNRQTLLRSMLIDKPTMAEEPRVRRDADRKPSYTRYPKLYTKPQKSQSWTKTNRFLYYWDASLRTACRESRAVLLHHLDDTKKGGYILEARNAPYTRPLLRHTIRINVYVLIYAGVILYVSDLHQKICVSVLPSDGISCSLGFPSFAFRSTQVSTLPLSSTTAGMMVWNTVISLCSSISMNHPLGGY